MDRVARLLSTSDRNSRILEVGAGYNPAAPKAAGWNSHVVDHATADELREKYATAGVDLSAIEAVDTLWRDGMLHEAVPAALHGSFDTLIASHVIEHVPDFVGFLISAQHLLGSHGSVVLAVPDRRFCFDYFKPATMTGDVLEAHARRASRHSRRAAWNHFAYSVLVDGGLAGAPGPLDKVEFLRPFAVAAAVHATYRDAGDEPLIDYHAWQFTPSGFALVILELGQMGLIDWHVASLQGPIGCEFFAVLRRGAEPMKDTAELQDRRMRLLKRQLLETREQIEFALAGHALRGVTLDGGIAPERRRGRRPALEKLSSLSSFRKNASAH